MGKFNVILLVDYQSDFSDSDRFDIGTFNSEDEAKEAIIKDWEKRKELRAEDDDLDVELLKDRTDPFIMTKEDISKTTYAKCDGIEYMYMIV